MLQQLANTIRRRMCLGLTIFLSAVGLCGRSAGAGEAPHKPADVHARELAGGPYCGIYALYGALGALQVTVRFEDLVSTKYIHSFEGSNAAELQTAANDCGAHAKLFNNLTIASLRAAENPIILHVRKPGKGMPYSHWILFLGLEGDSARVVDAPNDLQLLPLSEMLAVWDGVGLVISREPVSTGTLFVASWMWQATVLLSVAIVVLALRWLLPRFLGTRHNPLPHVNRCATPVVGGLGLAALACCFAVGNEAVNHDSFTHNPVAVALVAARHFEPPLPMLGVNDVADMIGRPDVTIIDARLPSGFAAGHLKGAISFPISLSLLDRDKLLEPINPNNQVIVYCQSKTCPWSHAIASDLFFRGYRRIALFPGGWQEWQTYAKSQRYH